MAGDFPLLHFVRELRDLECTVLENLRMAYLSMHSDTGN